MKREDAIGRLGAPADEIRARGAVSLYRLGSTARGDAGDDSGVDLFINCASGRRFSSHDRLELEDFRRAVATTEVDPGLRGELRPVLRDDRLRHAVRML